MWIYFIQRQCCRLCRRYRESCRKKVELWVADTGRMEKDRWEVVSTGLSVFESKVLEK